MFLSDFEYRESLSYLEHPLLRSALLQELDHWGQEELRVSILNWYCDEPRNRIGRRLRLILWERAEEKQMMGRNDSIYGCDPAIQKAAAQQFAALARKHRTYRKFWDPEKFLVVFDTLRDEIQKRTLAQARARLEALATEDIWRVIVALDTIHIFYETDEQLRRYETDGTSRDLRRRCGDIVADLDTRRVFPEGPECIFTSHQTLEEKYEGNLFYYFK